MKNKILLSLALLISAIGFAQQDPQFTHYMYNTIHLNPAYAGSREMMTVGLLHRSQWMGLDGAPTTQTFYIHSPLRNQSLNIGLSAVNDKIGPVANTLFYGDFAYRMKVSEHTKLAFGLKAGFNYFQPKLAEVETDEGNDPSFIGSTLRSTLAPNFGFGMYLNNDRYYLGLSVPKIIQNNLETGDTTSVSEKRHYWFIAGYILPVGNSVKLKPTAQAKIVENAPASLDITAEAIFNDLLSVGLGYRFGDAFDVMAGVQVTPQFKAGVSYDITTSPLRQVNSGSLEFMLMYDFLFKENKLKSPRYF